MLSLQPLMFVGAEPTNPSSLWLQYLGAMEMKVRLCCCVAVVLLLLAIDCHHHNSTTENVAACALVSPLTRSTVCAMNMCFPGVFSVFSSTS